MSRIIILALDLEGTLISNAMSQISRLGLFEFLERCRAMFPRIVMFTTVKEELFRKIAQLLVEEKAAPAWFAQVEYVAWEGKTIDYFDYPYDESDVGLAKVLGSLEQRLGQA